MKRERHKWCEAHSDWSLDDWKNVIWSDETSVVLGQRRGQVKVWRKTDEQYHKDVIRGRWKGFCEFMFWGCFSWYNRGPCHVWVAETAAEKKKAEAQIAELNALLEPIKKEEWQLNTAMRRAALRNQSGPKPEWRWNQKTGKMTREALRGGIDWWRYHQVILKPKLLPFALREALSKPGTVVQEDKAPPHNNVLNHQLYAKFGVQRLVWCPNSPDLNAIEPAWMYLKKSTTVRGAPRDKKSLTAAWLSAWQSLSQQRIQQWVERIPHNVQRVIELQGDNCYREGKSGGSVRPYNKEYRQNYRELRKQGLRPGDGQFGDLGTARYVPEELFDAIDCKLVDLHSVKIYNGFGGGGVVESEDGDSVSEEWSDID